MRRLLLLTLLTLLAAGTLAGCFYRVDRRGGDPCFDTGDCNDEINTTGGEVDIEACIDGECEDVDCLSSTDCVVGQYCDVEDDAFRCREGCETDGDCFAGQSCVEGSCAAYGCRSTILDCDFNEVCDVDSGQCVEASGPQCAQCDPLGNQIDNQGTSTQCDDVLSGHPICGQGGVCGGSQDDPQCWTACTDPSGTDECPMGFACSFASWQPALGCDPVAVGPYCLPVDGCDP